MMIEKQSQRIGFVFALAAMGIAACGGASASGEKPGTASVMINAAQGGTITLGKASLLIPAGALPADTMIELISRTPPSTLPDQGTLKGLSYDFGPNGTQFAAPVTLRLPVSSAAPAGKRTVISWFHEGSTVWTDLPTTTSEAGVVSAPVDHFTTFIVRFIDGGAVDCSFPTSCSGGNLVGTWKIDGFCADVTDNNGFTEFCPTATVNITLNASGNVTFSADNTYSVNITTSGTLNLDIPASCTMGAASCAEFGTLIGSATCTGSVTTKCSCTGPIDMNPVAETGTYTTSGNTFITTDSVDGVPSNPSAYCVTGTKLKVKDVPDPTNPDQTGDPTIVWSATKQ